MKKVLLTLAFALVQVLSVQNVKAEVVEKVVFSEDFSKMVTGSVGAPDDATVIVEDGKIKADYVAKAGWTVASAKSAGGTIYVPAKTYLSTPAIDLSAAVDAKYILEYDIYSDSPAGDEGGDYIANNKADGSGYKSQTIEGSTWTHITQELTNLPANAVMKIEFRTTFSPFYLKNVKVKINAEESTGEAADFVGKYTLTSTKRVIASNQIWSGWVQENFNFLVLKNTGDDADVLPYVVSGFPLVVNGNTGNATAVNQLKAKNSADGKSLVILAGHDNPIYGTNDHFEMMDGNGAAGAATEITITPNEDGSFGIPAGVTVIHHTAGVPFLGIAGEQIDVCALENVRIEKATPTNFAGKYVFDATKTVLSTKGVWGTWAKENFEFKVVANTGDDADVYPYLIKSFPAFENESVVTKDLKATAGADGISLVIPVGKDINKLKDGSQYYYLSDANGYELSASQIVITEVSEGKYTIHEGMGLVFFSQGVSFLGIPDETVDVAKYEDITIERAAPIDFTGNFNFTATKEILWDKAAWATWAKEDFDFQIVENEGADKDAYPYLVRQFPGFDSETVITKDLKAMAGADGMSLVIPVKEANKLKDGSQYYCLADVNGYENSADVIVITEVAEGEYTIEGGMDLVFCSAGVAFLGIPDERHDAAKYSDIKITFKSGIDGIEEIVVDEETGERGESTVKKQVLPGVYSINGVRLRKDADISGLQPGFYIVNGKKVIVRR